MKRTLLRRYAASGTAIAGLYLLNRFLLVPLTGWRLPAWHGADFLAGGLMLCFLNGLLLLARRRPVERIFPASLFLLGCGLFWEIVTPLYLSRSVGDPWDVLAVWLGGWPCWPSGGGWTVREPEPEHGKNPRRKVLRRGLVYSWIMPRR